jgi:uncharacterized protein (UPF0335 family)
MSTYAKLRAHFTIEEVLMATSTQLSLQRLTDLARRGAVSAVETLEAEVAAIKKAFPDIFGRTNGRGMVTANRRTRRSRRRGTLSAAGRAAIAAAQKARWAKIKNRRSASGGTTAARTSQRRHAMSAAQRKAVSERMKKYWAGRRKAKQTSKRA